jgi:hypothetical protein
MKKIILLLSITIVSLAACKKKSTSTTPEQTPVATTSKEVSLIFLKSIGVA